MKATVETITPKTAKEYLKFNVSNRPLHTKTVEFYAEQMRKGQWKLNGEGICFAEGGALLNGQHRLQAVVRAGVPVQMLVIRGADNDSFVTYDSGRSRKVSDIFAISDIPNYAGISTIVNKYIRLHLNNNLFNQKAIKQINISRQDILDEYNKSPELYQESFSFAGKCTRKIKLFMATEIGGLYVFLIKDLKHNKKKVESFFTMLFFNEDVENNTINLLRNKIIESNLANKKYTGTYKQAILAKTWNAYIKGKVLKTLSYNEEKEGKIQFI